MKKQVTDLLSSKSASLAISPVATLTRVLVDDPAFQPVDRLTLRLNPICGVEFSESVEIQARDYSGIMAEVESGIRQMMASAADRLCSYLRSGYGCSDSIQAVPGVFNK